MPVTSNETPNEIQVTSRDVSCDGGLGAYGHPKVYLRITGKEIFCPYCSRRFILKAGAARDATH